MSGDTNTQLRGRRMTVAAAVMSSDASLGDRFRALGAKLLARKAGTSPRTAEKWIANETSPTWRHVKAMLTDDVLCRELLIAAGRSDIAEAHTMLAQLREAKRLLDGADLS